MGYYSDVALALTRNGVENLNAKLADKSIPPKTLEETRYLLEHAEKHLVDEDSGSEIWYWENLKWYTSDPEYFPEVDFIENFFDNIDEDDYRFIRVGEDYEDSEVRGDFYDDPFDMTLCRNISLADAG